MLWFTTPLPSFHPLRLKKAALKIDFYLMSTANVVYACNLVVTERKILKIFHLLKRRNII
jgi:hypothetical protein